MEKELVETNPRIDACCEACSETHRMVKEIHEGISKIAPMLSQVAEHPMGRMMAKQMGIPIDALNQNGNN